MYGCERARCVCVSMFLHVAWMTQSFGGPVVMDCTELSSQFDGCAEVFSGARGHLWFIPTSRSAQQEIH